jgi:hypothetical protein
MLFINFIIASIVLSYNYIDYIAFIKSDVKENILIVLHNNKKLEIDIGQVKPWKLLLYDINKDNFPEVLIGVQKEAYFDKVEKKRIRIYTLDENGIYPFYFATFAPDEILDFNYYNNYLVLLHPNNRISALQWDEFGFIGESFSINIIENKEANRVYDYTCLCNEKSCFLLFKDKLWRAYYINNCGREKK